VEPLGNSQVVSLSLAACMMSLQNSGYILNCILNNFCYRYSLIFNSNRALSSHEQSNGRYIFKLILSIPFCVRMNVWKAVKWLKIVGILLRFTLVY
jgi:hypothetical protein